MSANRETASVESTTDQAYFETVEGQPKIMDVIYGLHGVCAALDSEAINAEMDYEKRCLVSNLATAARVLSQQLYDRYTSTPPTKRQIETASKASDDWRKITEQARVI